MNTVLWVLQGLLAGTHGTVPAELTLRAGVLATP
jgi:hypothetical protein